MPLRLALCLLVLCSPAAAHGGICWLQQGKEAKCTMILKTGVTWEECCANGNVDVAWSNYTYPGNKISLLGFLGLVTCHPCKESCEGVVCGPDKVCKMKHGRPQCACAPDCSSLPRKLQVCGSDGYTYRDECDLLTAKCRDHPDLEVMYQGKCKSRVLLQRGVSWHPHLRGGPDGQRPLRDVPHGPVPRAHQPGPRPVRQQQRHLPVGVPPAASHLPPRPLHRRAPLRELLSRGQILRRDGQRGGELCVNRPSAEAELGDRGIMCILYKPYT